jgi:hypothetical protein
VAWQQRRTVKNWWVLTEKIVSPANIVVLPAKIVLKPSENLLCPSKTPVCPIKSGFLLKNNHG